MGGLIEGKTAVGCTDVGVTHDEGETVNIGFDDDEIVGSPGFGSSDVGMVMVGVDVVDDVGNTAHVGSHVGIHVGKAVDGGKFDEESKTEDVGMGVGQTTIEGEIGFVEEATGTHEGIHVGRTALVGEISGSVTKVGCGVEVDSVVFVGFGGVTIPTPGDEVTVVPVGSVGLVVEEGSATLFEFVGSGVTLDPATPSGVVDQVGWMATVGVGKIVGLVTVEEDVESVESGKPTVLGDGEAVVNVTEGTHGGIHVDKSVYVGTTVRVGVGTDEGPCEIIGVEELEVSGTTVGETNVGKVDEAVHVGIHMEETSGNDGKMVVGKIEFVGKTVGSGVATTGGTIKGNSVGSKGGITVGGMIVLTMGIEKEPSGFILKRFHI